MSKTDMCFNVTLWLCSLGSIANESDIGLGSVKRKGKADMCFNVTLPLGSIANQLQRIRYWSWDRKSKTDLRHYSTNSSLESNTPPAQAYYRSEVQVL